MSVFAELHFYEDAALRSAAMNMAIDEALLEDANAPSLRCYEWRKPSLSLGYFGRYADVAEYAGEREMVRRWTGGGIVFHGTDLTYSIVLPARLAASMPSARVIYEQVHDAIRRALSGRIEVALATINARKVSDACFANPVVADVLVQGRKIAGAAQRRTRTGLLQQGSVQYEALPAGFADAFAFALCPQRKAMPFPPALTKRARQLADEKYGTTAWLRQR